MKSRRVVVTGMGAVTPLGNTLEETWAGLLAGRSGVGALTRVDKDLFGVKVAAEVKDFDIEPYTGRKEGRKMDRFTQYAIAASQMAMEDAGLVSADNLVLEEALGLRTGVWIGSGIGGMETLEAQMDIFKEKGARRVSPFFIPMLIPDMAAGQVSIRFGAKAAASCTVTACASGTNSIGDALRLIERGDADVMIAGGAEAPITNLALAGFCSNTALTLNPDPETASRPFDAKRDGFVIGEGAGILVLEELDHAQARGARIYAELAGYGTTSDAHHITAPAPEGEGAARAMRQALADAQLAPETVGYINAHGTSTPFNDAFETAAIRAVFGAHADRLAVSSTKSMTGHLLGAAGGIEAAFTVRALVEGQLPPTIHLQEADPACDLDYVPNAARRADVAVGLSNSLGFGGHNATLVFRRWDV